MSTYEDQVDQQYLTRLESQIASLVQAQAPGAQLPTIFFFPGGLASNLDRALEPANSAFYIYYQAWLNLSVLFGAARDLQLDGDDDYQQQYVVPDGAVTFIPTYDSFFNWCAVSGVNVFVCAWDWRRESGRAADFFLNEVLPAIDAKVSQLGATASPLDNFWLVGHSFGGMVVKQILNQTNNPYVQKLAGALTVATPYYGSGGQLHRFFVGESDINCTLEPDGASNCTRIVSTMPANYEILFLDYATYQADAAQFLADDYPPPGYPSVDASSGNPADPYNPTPGQPTGSSSGPVRYIAGYNFSWTLLQNGAAAAQATSQPLDPAVAAKFWNIRCVQTESDGVTPLAETSIGHKWALAPANFDPDVGPDPVTDIPGAGDSVVPAWSGRLLGLPIGHVITLAGADLEHQNLMNVSQVQDAIAGLLGLPQPLVLLARASAATVKPDVASRAELERVKADVRRQLDRAGPDPFARRQALFKIVQGFSMEERKRLIARAYFDFYKSPAQRSVTKKSKPSHAGRVGKKASR